MASVLVYDLDKTRLRVVSGVLEGHDITRVHSLAQAERLAETEGFDVALADWTDSGGNQLTRTYAGLPQVRRPLVVLARDRFSPPDPESQLSFRARSSSARTGSSSGRRVGPISGNG
jgi:CheY-like chemotaxis protein